MKKIIFISFLWLSFAGYAQDNYIVKTDDGRRVLLKADYTWEYIDLVPKSNQTNSVAELPLQSLPSDIVDNVNCGLPPDFVEPKLNARVQGHLKRGRATMKDLKRKVAKDFKCESEDVFLISAREDKAKGVYTFCVERKRITYKRVGSNFFKKAKFL